MKVLFLILILKFANCELSEENDSNNTKKFLCKTFELNLLKDLKSLQNDFFKNSSKIQTEVKKLRNEEKPFLQKLKEIEKVQEQEIYKTHIKVLDNILDETSKTWPCSRPPLISEYDLGLLKKMNFYHEEKTKCHRLKFEKHDEVAIKNCSFSLLEIEKEIDELDDKVKLALQHKIDDFLNTNTKWNDHAKKANEAFEKWILKINEMNKPLIEEILKIKEKIRELAKNHEELRKKHEHASQELIRKAKEEINKCSGFELKDFLNGNLPENSIIGGTQNLEIPLYIIRGNDGVYGKFIWNQESFTKNVKILTAKKYFWCEASAKKLTTYDFPVCRVFIENSLIPGLLQDDGMCRIQDSGSTRYIGEPFYHILSQTEC